MEKLIPYGMANFRAVMEENYYYVDKTHFIPLLEKIRTPVFLRPRRFGKSLFTEMLRWYYDIKAAPLFETLFGGLYIGKHPTPLRNSYYFLALDFSGMSDDSAGDKDFVRKQFNARIISSIEFFLHGYAGLLKLDEAYISQFEEKNRHDAGGALVNLMALVQDRGGLVYCVIDEYDALTNAMAINYIHARDEENEYLNITKKGGFFRSFFEAVKNSMKLGLDRIFITGILPITISDMNSGFNIARWITHDPQFINMLGLTEGELEGLLQEVYQNNPGITLPAGEVKGFLKRYYNGYHFGKNSESVYNPLMVLSCLDIIIKQNAYPEVPADQNIRVQYNQVEYVFGRNSAKRDEVIGELTEKQSCKFKINLTRQFNLKDYKSGNYIPDCLYYLGLLTHGEGYNEFVIPNLVTYEMILGAGYNGYRLPSPPSRGRGSLGGSGRCRGGGSRR